MKAKKKYRDTASFGRRQEYSVIAELLKRGFDVYMTLVDDQGIDCVIRLNDKKYLDIQIKARSREAKPDSDIDVLVEFSPRKSLLEFVRIERELSEALGIKVDLLTEKAISPYLIDDIKRQMKVIYG